jgi:hypothetical protein
MTAYYLLNLKSNERRRARLTLEVGHSSETITVMPDDTGPTGTATPPEVIVLIATYRCGEPYRLFKVWFEGETPGVEYFTPSLGQNETGFEAGEWPLIAAELAAFYDDAVEITRGPERFYPYLPEDMHAYGVPMWSAGSWLGIPSAAAEDLSDDELRLLVALLLDDSVHQVWMWVEQVAPRREWLEGLSVDRPAEFTAGLSESVAEKKKVLRELGVFNPEHFAATRPYVRRLAGEGLSSKESSAWKIMGLPDSAELYRARLAGLHLYFSRVNSKLRIVFVHFD